MTKSSKHSSKKTSKSQPSQKVDPSATPEAEATRRGIPTQPSIDNVRDEPIVTPCDDQPAKKNQQQSFSKQSSSVKKKKSTIK